ncbi:hypothetical protein [Pseudomonas viridiflava]|uniref:hypothetical protein n=1 Tax=Pseudomonas viridiflava TaxID=33069 RepID=UPI000F02A975|nr:hypothetical protein [Pseudomonas viridiflava]
MSLRPLEKVSDLFFAIGDAIQAARLGVSVGNYDDFEGLIGDAQVLIEFERTSPGSRNNDGKLVHAVTVTLHAVISRARKFSSLEAANLTTALERLATDNRWGFGRHADLPQNMRSGPSIFQRGATGYDAWGCTFVQNLAIGPERPMPDPGTGRRPPVGDEVPMIWQVNE